jgi:hypothetical protein
MKIFKIYAIVASLFVLMTACGDDPKPIDTPVPNKELGNIEFDWKLVSVNGIEPEFTVYMSFEAGMFTIYQQIYTWDYVCYEGEYDIDGNKLSGMYWDGDLWKCSYEGEVSQDGSTLTLVSREDNPITSVYELCDIPQEVIDEATTRSAVEFDYHL